MTEDTIFDMASLSKCLVHRHLHHAALRAGQARLRRARRANTSPTFDPDHDKRAKVTVRVLLTHYSGVPADVSLKDPWGLAHPTRPKASAAPSTTPLQSAPEAVFRYSDINFILLGDARRDTLRRAARRLRAGAHLQTARHDRARAICPSTKPAARTRSSAPPSHWAPAAAWHTSHHACPPATGAPSLLPRIAPTAHDDECKVEPSCQSALRPCSSAAPSTTPPPAAWAESPATPASSPPRTTSRSSRRRCSIVSRAGPISRSSNPHSQLMTTPEQPGHYAGQLTLATAAEQSAIVHGEKGAARCSHRATPRSTDRISAASAGTSTPPSPSRAACSSPSAASATPASPAPRSGWTPAPTPTSSCSRTPFIRAATHRSPTCAAKSQPPSRKPCSSTTVHHRKAVLLPPRRSVNRYPPASWQAPLSPASTSSNPLTSPNSPLSPHNTTTASASASSPTNPASTRTAAAPSTSSPPTLPKAHPRPQTHHPLLARARHLRHTGHHQHLRPEIDPTTDLLVTSLYGPTTRQTPLTTINSKTSTPSSSTCRTLASASTPTRPSPATSSKPPPRKARLPPHLDIIVLDRPNLIGGVAVQGPVSDPGHENYTDYMPAPRPPRHDARRTRPLSRQARHQQPHRRSAHRRRHAALDALRVLRPDRPALDQPQPQPAQPHRHDPASRAHASSKQRTPPSAAARPPPSSSSAPVFRPRTRPPARSHPHGSTPADVAAALNARHIPGVTFAATTTTVDDDPIHPYHGQTIEAVRITVTDRNALDSPGTRRRDAQRAAQALP